MKRSLVALIVALTLSPVPLAAQAPADPELSLGQYQALTVEQRTLYIAGLADMLDAAAAMVPSNNRIPLIAECTHGFGKDELVSAVEAGAPHIKMKWSEKASAAEWFITTMIYVCQLQLPPPEQ